MKVEMIYLSQEDVIRCGGMSMDKAIDDLEEVFRPVSYTHLPI